MKLSAELGILSGVSKVGLEQAISEVELSSGIYTEKLGEDESVCKKVVTVKVITTVLVNF